MEQREAPIFARLRPARAPGRAPGTGLGLATSKAIVEAHGGTTFRLERSFSACATVAA